LLLLFAVLLFCLEGKKFYPGEGEGIGDVREAIVYRLSQQNEDFQD
jgi:hypothetical protein